MNALVDHEVQLEVDGQAYQGWTTIDVDRAIDQMSGRFTLRLAAKERTEAEDWPIGDGAQCRVTLRGVPLITGYVDAITRFVSGDSRGIDVRGRDRTADLIDCSAVNTPGSWRGRALEQIVSELVEPFQIPVEIEGSTGNAFKRFALQPGETVFGAIERLCRYRGFLAWTDGAGILRIGNPDSGVSLGRLVEGENVLEATATRDTSDRYSDIIVKGQASGDDERSGAAVAQVRGEARDAGVLRYRPLMVIGEEQSDRTSLNRRAQWEATVRAGRSTPVQVITPGWLTRSGQPFAPGMRAQCDVPSVEVMGELLVQEVRLIRDAENGTLAILDLIPPEAFASFAQAEPRA